MTCLECQACDLQGDGFNLLKASHCWEDAVISGGTWLILVTATNLETGRFRGDSRTCPLTFGAVSRCPLLPPCAAAACSSLPPTAASPPGLGDREEKGALAFMGMGRSRTAEAGWRSWKRFLFS